MKIYKRFIYWDKQINEILLLQTRRTNHLLLHLHYYTVTFYKWCKYFIALFKFNRIHKNFIWFYKYVVVPIQLHIKQQFKYKRAYISLNTIYVILIWRSIMYNQYITQLFHKHSFQKSKIFMYYLHKMLLLRSVIWLSWGGECAS